MTKTVFDLAHDNEPTPPRLAMVGARCSLHGGVPVAPLGSRRRRLWDLSASAHCPVVGLCLPVAALRRLMQRHAAKVPPGDYELHTQAVGAARSRSAMSEAMQRELDTRHAPALREAARLKCADALRAWWLCQRHGAEMAGTLWSVLTHARCTTELEDELLGQVHMQQHEVGQMARAMAARHQQMQLQQLRMEREHAAMTLRLEEQRAQAALARERLQAELVKTRGQVLAREARIAQLEAEAAEQRQARPDLPARLALSQQLAGQTARLRELQRALHRVQDDNTRLRAERRAAAKAVEPVPAPAPAAPGEALAALRSRAVLCVGGRTRAVPAYRQVVESAGAQFMHHDGGDEDNLQRLEHTLAAADLVVCQTGCISHDAYWRVKEHCRRTGKHCVFVEQPSASSLQRALHAHAEQACAQLDAVPRCHRGAAQGQA